MSLFHKSCSTCYTPAAPAPNPDPRRWTITGIKQFANGYVLLVKYHDATNLEGLKAMVYRGKFDRERAMREGLDPHFTDSPKSPVARFRPDEEGLKWALELARSL